MYSIRILTILISCNFFLFFFLFFILLYYYYFFACQYFWNVSPHPHYFQKRYFISVCLNTLEFKQHSFTNPRFLLRKTLITCILSVRRTHSIWHRFINKNSNYFIENLAYRRPVFEKNPWPTTDKDYGSQNAVDGLYTDRSAAGGQCSISADNNHTDAVLRVDLEAVVSISHITIYFRTENQQSITQRSKVFFYFFHEIRLKM